MSNNDSDYMLKFTLKQHTPIIHFQAHQKGATLRATELKPKLDRFLIEKLGDGDYEAGKKIVKEKNWLIGKGEHFALEYKVKIHTSGVKFHDIDLQKKTYEGPKFKQDNNKDFILDDEGNKIPIPNPFPNFFAMMGDDWRKNKKYFSTALKINLSIKVLNVDLKEYIQNNFSKFLLHTNFGTRQSKGFGSFYIDKSDKSTYIPIEKVLKDYTYWSFNVSTNALIKKNVVGHNPFYGEMYSLFFKIELFYKTLRSGINEKNRNGETIFYFKSLLYEYMQSLSDYDMWDKAVLKAKFIDNVDNSNQRILSRDMLGLSTIQEYKKTDVGNFTVRHPIKGKDNNTEYPENIVQRFKSPILFKPIKNDDASYTVYILHRPLSVYENFVSQKTLTILKETGKGRNATIKDYIDIKLPTDFKLLEFLKESFSNTDVQKHILKYQKSTDKKYIEHDNYSFLKKIYDDIQKGNQ